MTCLANVLLRGPCLSSDEADEFDKVEHEAHIKLRKGGQRAHHAAVPAVQLSGPLRTVFSLPGKFSEHHCLGIGHDRW